MLTLLSHILINCASVHLQQIAHPATFDSFHSDVEKIVYLVQGSDDTDSDRVEIEVYVYSSGSRNGTHVDRCRDWGGGI